MEDDGVGIQKEEIERLMAGEEIVQKKGERKHIGLTNIRDRIHYLYGQSYGIQAERKEDGGTRIFLRLPYEFITEEEEERR